MGTAGRHRRNTGLAILISREAPVRQVTMREVKDPELQLLVCDMHVHGAPMRVVISHGDPRSGHYLKVKDYKRG